MLGANYPNQMGGAAFGSAMPGAMFGGGMYGINNMVAQQMGQLGQMSNMMGGGFAQQQQPGQFQNQGRYSPTKKK